MKPDISLDLYKIFVTVAKNGNMSLAARELFISQPAVSMAVRQLEDRLGKPLLARSSKGITLTAEGRVMYDYLSSALGLIETAEQKYAEMAELKTGEVRIGASDTIMSRYLLPYIERYIEKHPGINFIITNRTTNETVKLLKSSQTDIGFVNLPVEADNSLEIIECLTVRDCLIGGAKYSYFCDKGLSIAELGGLPLMLLEKASNSRRLQDKFAAGLGHTLSPVMELGSMDLLVSCVKINLGLAIVTKEFTDIDNKTVFEIPLTPVFPARAIGLIKLRGVSLSHAAASFVDLVFELDRV
jgi:DNA-binding transcriptional LysR family regulator